MPPIIKYIISGIGLVLIQVLFLQQLRLGAMADYFVPFIYPMFILVMPFTFSKHWLMVIALILGVIVDMFYDTPGINASAAVVVAFLRPITLNSLAPRDGFDQIKPPSYVSMGMNRFIVYVLILTFIYHLWFFSLEVFKISYIHIIFIQAFLSTLLASVLIIITDILAVPKN